MTDRLDVRTGTRIGGLRACAVFALTLLLATCGDASGNGPRGVQDAAPSPSLTAAARDTSAAPSTSPVPSLSTPGASVAAASTACRLRSALPDPACTPGATDPAVTQGNIASTICVSGYTQTVRPPSSYTDQLKVEQMRAYGLAGSTADYEEDHLVPLELGGAARDPKNLWPEPRAGSPAASEKDALENHLHSEVCAGRMSLTSAQQQVASDWVVAWLSYKGLATPSSVPPATATAAPAVTFVATAVPTPSAPAVATTPAAQITSTPSPVPTLPPTSAPAPTPSPATSAAAGAQLAITQLFYDGVVPSTEADEFVEVKNVGSAAQSMAGWHIVSVRAGQSYAFPAVSIAAGQTCRVYTNQLHPEWCSLSWGRGSAVWNNAGDRANLVDPAGNVVSTVGYKGY